MAARNAVFELVFKGTQDGKGVANVFHYLQDPTDGDPFDNIDLEAFIDTVRLSYSFSLSPFMSASVAYSTAVLTLYDVLDLVPFHGLRPHPIAQFVKDISGTFQGAVGTDYLPNFNAWSIQKRSPTPGRRFRGSTHLPGLPESSTTGNNIHPTILPAFQTAVDTSLLPPFVVLGSLLTYHFFPVIFSLTNAIAKVATQPNLVDHCVQVTATPVNQKIGTMKRRKKR